MSRFRYCTVIIWCSTDNNINIWVHCPHLYNKGFILKMTPKHFDEIFSRVGSFGNYQVCLFIIVCMITMFSVDNMYNNFTGFKMDHWCLVPELSNLPFDVQKYVAIPEEPVPGTSGIRYSRCKVKLWIIISWE